jgi:hypothetical protein
MSSGTERLEALKELVAAKGLRFLIHVDEIWEALEKDSRGALALLEIPEVRAVALEALSEDLEEHIAHPWE